MATTTTTNHGTGIEWTHVPGYKGETWNPVRGCFKISPGCKHCYAETFAERWRGVAGHPYEQGFDLRLVPEKLDEPLRAMKPRAYFVNSMSDLHQEGVPDYFVDLVYGVMNATDDSPAWWGERNLPSHLYMVLTKRAERMAAAVSRMRQTALAFGEVVPSLSTGTHRMAHPYHAGIPRNIWLGVSVEDCKYGLPRVDILRTIPAAVRFLSVEPLLEDLGDIDLTDIHWVIVGGESGAEARPFDLRWARSIVAQCREAGAAVFVKQLGARPVDFAREPEHQHIQLRDGHGGDMEEWPADLRVRELPRGAK